MEMQQLTRGGNGAGAPSPREAVSTGPLDGPLPTPKGGKFEASSAPATHCFNTAPTAPTASTAPAARAAPAASAAPLSRRSQRWIQPLALSAYPSTLLRLHSSFR